MNEVRPLVLSMLLLAACAGDTDPFDVGAGGKADEDGVAILDVELDSSLYDLEVRRDRLVVARVHLEAGESMVATMRAQSAGLDSYLLVKTPDNETVDASDLQALLPMALEDDAVVAYTAPTAGEVLVFAAGGAQLDTGGRFHLDVIGLSADPGARLSITHAGLRAVAAQLREREPRLIADLESAVLVERADGLVEIGEGFKDLPLSERAGARQREAAINELRSILFDELAGDESTAARIGAAAAEVWAQLR